MAADLLDRVRRLAEIAGADVNAAVPEGLCIHDLVLASCQICSKPRPLGKTTACRSCQSPVVWCLTENNRRMPVDPDPDEKGNLVVAVRRGDGMCVMRYLRPELAEEERAHGTRLYLSHFVTCPSADEHRRSRRSA